MAFVLNRNLNVEIELEGSKISLDMTDMKATERLAYMHEVEVLQDRLEEGDKHAVKDIYMLNIELLTSQVTDIDGVIDSLGNKVKLPKDDDDKREFFDALGLDFITSACNGYAQAMNKGVEGKGKKK